MSAKRGRPMAEAPDDGREILAYVQNTLRSIVVRWVPRERWAGGLWVEGNGEKWDTYQLVGWDEI
jgi:hypothetical protein